MIDKIVQLDQQLLIYINNLGSETFDAFWLQVTNQFSWIPLFAVILVLLFKKLGWKKGAFTLLFIVALVAFSDQFTNLIKNSTGRLRPCNNEAIRPFLRTFEYRPGGFSFWSGHASLSATFTTFIILLFRKGSKYWYALILFPVLFGFSRMYLGVHFPLDITAGYVSGIVLGTVLFWCYRKLYARVFHTEYQL
ncbi:Phosphoesterase [Tenacibaculum litopenaei]|uniref:phosphatase PAP2 family protein n=1 Tax=Tenacibaculum litopenaei TaxID=396016 RepID=UPI003894AF38